METLEQFLDDHHIRFVTVLFSQAYTEQEIAGSERIAGKELARTVPVSLGGEPALVVLPADAEIDYGRLGQSAAAEACPIGEAEYRQRFPGIERDLLPPFGNLWDVKVVVSDLLVEDVEIAFRAGSRRRIIKMNYDDFDRLARPIPMDFARRLAPGEKASESPAACGAP